MNPDARSAAVRIRLLGAPRIEREGRTRRFALKRGWALLVLVLACRQVGRERIIAWLWPDDAPGVARAKLRRTLHAVGRTVGPGVLVSDSDSVRIVREGDWWCDLVALERAERNLRLGSPTAPTGIDLAVLEADRAELLAGFALPSCDELERWLDVQREAVRQSILHLLARRAEEAERQHRLDEAETLTRRQLVIDPCDEAASRRLMRLLFQDGRRAAAVAELDRLRLTLRDELALEPDAETLAQGERLRSDRAGALRAPPPEVRYAQARDERGDVVHLAYQVIGQGPLEIACIPGFVSHCEHAWADGGPGPFFRQLAADSRVLLFDRRGVGLSDRLGHEPSTEATVDDLRAVLDAAGFERPVLMGFSEGGPAALTFAAREPRRARGLVLYGTMARGAHADDYPWALRPEQFDRWLALLTAAWGRPASLGAFAPGYEDDPALARWWSRMLRLGSSPGSVRAVLRAFQAIDVRSLLGRIRTPALVMHRLGDRAVPVGAARHLAANLPAATLKELPGDEHWWWLGDTTPLVAALGAFLAGLADFDRTGSRR